MSLRRMDFRCPTHGFFEASEPISAPVSTHARCPECPAICPKVIAVPIDLEQSYRCGTHGVFKSRPRVNEAGRPCFNQFCPTCGALAPPHPKPHGPDIGKINKGVFVIDLPTGKPGSGQFTTMLRDEAEARLAYEPPVPFADEKARREVLSDRIDQLMAAQDRGETIGRPPVDLDTVPESVKKALTSER